MAEPDRWGDGGGGGLVKRRPRRWEILGNRGECFSFPAPGCNRPAKDGVGAAPVLFSFFLFVLFLFNLFGLFFFVFFFSRWKIFSNRQRVDVYFVNLIKVEKGQLVAMDNWIWLPVGVEKTSGVSTPRFNKILAQKYIFKTATCRKIKCLFS